MSKKGSTPAPTPVDPTVVAAAQTQSNEDTAANNQKLNMINTTGPNGSVSYQVDPSAPGGYSQNTTLSPGQQQTYDLTNQANNAALTTANQQIGRVNDALSTPFSYDSLPALQYGANAAPVQSSINSTAGPVQSSIAGGGPLATNAAAGQIQQSVAPSNFDQTTAGVTDAMWDQYKARLDPQWGLAQTQQDTKLANEGLGVNSSGYQNAQNVFGQAKNDAYGQALYQAVGAGAAEQNTLYNQNLSSGQFANAAQNQGYTQNMGNATLQNAASAQQFDQNQAQGAFANTAQQQQYGQDATNAQFANAAQSQAFNQSSQNAALNNATRSQAGQEMAYQQNLPLNQFDALMGSGQVTMPTAINYTPTQQANTDVLGANALSAQQQQAAYQAQLQQQSSAMGGLFGLGSAALGAAGDAGGFAALLSDRRLKTDIKRVGQTDDGLPIYTYRYKSGGPFHMGVMAQEVAAIVPHAVADMGGGVLGVHYGRL